MTTAKIFFISILFLLSTGLPSLGLAGNEGRGGIPDAIEVDAFNRYITGEGLKTSVRHYLQTLDLDKFNDKDKDIKATFEKMLQNGSILRDVDTPDNYSESG